MKTSFKIFAVVMSVAVLAACTSELSPALKEAQGLSQSIATMKGQLDSTLGAGLTMVTEKISGADSTVDSATMAGLNMKLAMIQSMKDKVSSWTAPAFPSAEELAKGELKEEDILAAQKAAMEEISGVKAECDAMMGGQ